MNFIQLVQRLAQECGVPSSGISSTVGQTAQTARLVNWIQTSWLDIQGSRDNWGWMRKPFAFNTVANVGDYSPMTTTNALTGSLMTDVRFWQKETFRCQRAALGVEDEQWLVEWDYQTFRDTYRFNQQVAGRPVVFAEAPNRSTILLGNVPDDVYVISGEYQSRPTELSSDTATPEIPPALHMVIVYKAMTHYGMYESAGEVVQRGNAEFVRLMGQLEREELPEISLGNPLA